MIRLTLDIVLKTDKVDEEALAKKLGAEKVTKQIASYVEAVVVPDIESSAKLKTVGASAHKHVRHDKLCGVLFESEEYEPVHEYQEA